MIESILFKIASAVFKKAVLSHFSAAAKAYEIYSVFDIVSDVADCIDTISDCNELDVSSLHVITDTLSGPVIDKLVSLGSTTFEVSKTNSGIYIASSLTNRFVANGLNFPQINQNRYERPSFPNFEKRNFPKF